MRIEDLQKELLPLTHGLMVRSETESPLELYYFENTQGLPLNASAISSLAGKTNSSELVVEPLDAFFNSILSRNSADAERFRQLQHKLQELLQNVQVYKSPEIGTTVYILGSTPEGDFAGLRTVVVET
ncbi:MAG TPA: nuclease A inhibitor family protein [Pontibacter sp.]